MEFSQWMLGVQQIMNITIDYGKQLGMIIFKNINEYFFFCFAN